MRTKSISLTTEQRKKAMLSDSEGIVLMMLYNLEKGMPSPDLKKSLLHLNQNDCDEAEEALDSLRSEGYVRYSEGTWFITDAGKEYLASFATIEKEPDAGTRGGDKDGTE